MPNQNTRPEYHSQVQTVAMLVGCRVEPNRVGTTYKWRSWARWENLGPGRVHRTEEGAWESALHRSGVRIRNRVAEHFAYDLPYPYNRRGRDGQ